MMPSITASLCAALLLTTPAAAVPICTVKLNGKAFITSLPCHITTEKGVTTFEQGNFFTAEIRNDTLRSNVARFGGPKSKQYELDSYGKVNGKEIDGGYCYNTQKLVICTSDSEE